MWQSSTIVTFCYFVSSFYSGNCYFSEVQIRCRIAHILVTDCARTADTQISIVYFMRNRIANYLNFDPRRNGYPVFWVKAKCSFECIKSCALQTSMIMYFFDAWPKINFCSYFHGKFGCFEMENQQNRWHSSMVTSYSPEWFLVKDLSTWYKSEAHSCRQKRGLFTLIKFGITALPLRTWRHYHFLRWCFLSCIHLNNSKVLIKMVIKLWTKDIRYVFPRIIIEWNCCASHFVLILIFMDSFLRLPNEQLPFLSYGFHVIIQKILSHLSSHSLTHSHSHSLSQWNMKIIWPAQQKIMFSFCFTSVLFWFHSLLFCRYLFDIRVRAVFVCLDFAFVAAALTCVSTVV